MAGLKATIHCIARSTGTRERGTFTTQGKVIYRDQIRVIELLLFRELEIKQHMTQNNVENQHKHKYSLYIGSLCNACFTCIVTSQVFVEI